MSMKMSADKGKTKQRQALSSKLHNLTRSNKLSSLLIVLVSLVIIIATAISTTNNINNDYVQTLNRRAQLNSNIAKSVELQINNVLQKAEQASSFAAYMYIYHNHALDLQNWLVDGWLVDQNFASISIINNQGHLVASGGSNGHANDYSKDPIFNKLKAKPISGILIGKPIYNSWQERWLLPIYKCIEDESGKFVGVVVLNVDQSAFTVFFKILNLQDAFIELSGPDGVIYSRVMGEHLVLGNNNHSWNTHWFGQDSNTYIDDGRGIDDVKRIVSFLKMADYDILITVGTSYKNAFAITAADKGSKILNSAVIYILVVIFASLLIYLIRRQDKIFKTTQSNEALFRATFNHSAMGIARIAPDGKILETNTKFQHLLGYSKNDLLNKNIIDLLSEADKSSAQQYINDRITKYYLGMPPEIERVYIHKNGSKIWVNEALSVVRKANGVPDFLVSAIQDISARKKLEDQLSHAASHDLLTKLPNRLLLQHKLASVIATAEKEDKLVAVLFLDLNGFKNINDNYGHRAGDILLELVAKRLKGAVRSSSGDIVARYGGDEFVIALLNLKDKADGELVANKIAASINQPFDLGLNVNVRTSISIGAAFYPQNSTNINELMTQADFAMYYAKNNGFTYACWDDSIHKNVGLKAIAD